MSNAVMRTKTNEEVLKLIVDNSPKNEEEIIEVSDEQRQLYNMVMSNIRPFSSKKSKNHIGVITIPLSLLFIDKRYQGLRTHKNLNKLIKNWDEQKLGCITIVPHPEECRFAVVDGQGRVMVATRLGYEALNAIVLLSAPQNDKKARLKFEAEVFIGQDDETEDLKPLEKHLARVLIGDEAATILDEMFSKYDIKYTGSKGNREKSVLGSYPNTYKIASRNGRYCLDFIFSIIKNAGWDKETNGYSVFITESLKTVWVDWQRAADRKRIHDFLSEKLRELDPTLFSSKARAQYAMRRDTRTCCRLYMEDMVEKGLGLKRSTILI